MWGLPIGLALGGFMYYVNRLFAGFITAHSKHHLIYVVILVLLKYLIILGVLVGLAFADITAMLYGAGGLFASLVGLAIYGSRRRTK